MLNPDTSSDSLSVKSKGVRLVSAKTVIIHEVIIGSMSILVINDTSFIFIVSSLFDKVIAVKIKMAIDTS